MTKKLTDEFFFRFSPPEQLHSDQGRNFESETISEICKLLGVVKTRTTPYHPQSDGLVERFNRTLLDMLSTAAGEHPFDWECHLRRLCLAYNTSVHPTTGHTPFSSCSVARYVCRWMLCLELPPHSHPQYPSTRQTSERVSRLPTDVCESAWAASSNARRAV